MSKPDTQLDQGRPSTPAPPARRRPAPLRPVTRRNFIVWQIGGLVAAIGAAITAPLLVYLYPSSGSNARTSMRIVLGTALDAIREGQTVQFNAPARTGFVMTDGGGVNHAGDVTFGAYLTRSGGQLHVFGITCPHLGCSYGLNGDSTRFLCPCHGSQFSFAGQVLHGPAVNPLSHLAWRRGDGPNVIMVDGVAAPE